MRLSKPWQQLTAPSKRKRPHRWVCNPPISVLTAMQRRCESLKGAPPRNGGHPVAFHPRLRCASWPRRWRLLMRERRAQAWLVLQAAQCKTMTGDGMAACRDGMKSKLTTKRCVVLLKSAPHYCACLLAARNCTFTFCQTQSRLTHAGSRGPWARAWRRRWSGHTCHSAARPPSPARHGSRSTSP